MRRLLSLFPLLFLLSGCASEPVEQQFFAMDTLMSITAYGKKAESAMVPAQQEVNRLEAIWSRTREGSDLSRLNARAGDGAEVSISQETGRLLSCARSLWSLTGGALDVTIAPVMDAWGFGTASSFGEAAYRVPSQEELAALLPLVDGGGLSLSPQGTAARLSRPGMAVDLGALAKGAAADRLVELLREEGVTSAFLDLGGNITALGGKPDGSPWRVGIRDPRGRTGYFCVLSIRDQTCSTSGGYERYFEEDGVRYHHILDPSTGAPASSGLLSVTAVSPNGALADGLSTACFILGAERSLELWRAQGEALSFELVLVEEGGRVLVTEGLEHDVTFQGEEAGYTYEMVRR